MAIDREVANDTPLTVESVQEGAGDFEPGRTPRPTSRVSRIAIAVCGVIGFVLIAWFFVAWLVLDRHVVDSAGESIGSAFAILLVVSLIGAFRRNRDRG